MTVVTDGEYPTGTWLGSTLRYWSGETNQYPDALIFGGGENNGINTYGKQMLRIMLEITIEVLLDQLQHLKQAF